MITIATCLWDPNEASDTFSLAYDESWAEKLYRGFKRNLTRPFRFAVYTDRERKFSADIEQRQLREPFDYGAMLQPLKLNEPMIVVGLDTVVTGNCDALADYCLLWAKAAVPRDPIYKNTVCNGVVLAPGGEGQRLLEGWTGQNDMEHIRSKDVAVIDDLFPGQVLSYRIHVYAEHAPRDDVRIVYFHGRMKPHEISDPWIEEHWR